MTYPRNLPNLNLLELGKPPPCRPSSKARTNPNYKSWVKSGLRVSHTCQFARFLLNFMPKATAGSTRRREHYLQWHEAWSADNELGSCVLISLGLAFHFLLMGKKLIYFPNNLVAADPARH
jgi:hypothetical protein